MTQWFLFPLIGTPQTFQITMQGINYLMTVKWNASPDAGWEFDLALSDTAVSILAGQPFVTGANMLANLGYLGIGGSLFAYTNGNPDAVPTFTNLGSDSNLYFVVTN